MKTLLTCLMIMISTTAHSGNWHMKPVWCGEMDEIVATLNITNHAEQFLLDGKGLALLSGGYADTYTVVYGDKSYDESTPAGVLTDDLTLGGTREFPSFDLG